MFSGWDGVDMELNQTSFDRKSSARNITMPKISYLFQSFLYSLSDPRIQRGGWGGDLRVQTGWNGILYF